MSVQKNGMKFFWGWTTATHFENVLGDEFCFYFPDEVERAFIYWQGLGLSWYQWEIAVFIWFILFTFFA